MILKLSIVVIISFFIDCNSMSGFLIGAKEEFATSRLEVQNNSAKVKNLLSEGNELYHKNKIQESIEVYKKANSIKQTEDGYYLLGLSYIKQDELTKADEVLNLGLSLNPLNEKILSTQALVKTSLGENENALTIYEKLRKNYPKNDQYTFKYSLELKSLKKWDESYAEFKKIKEENFTNKSQIYLHLGDVCFERKEYSIADEYFAKAKLADSKIDIIELKKKIKLTQSLEKGDEFFRIKNYPKAIQNYLNVLEINSQSVPILTKLGNTYFLNGDLDRAKEYLQKSQELENNNLDVYLTLSSIYSQKGNLENALLVLRKGITHFPNDSDLFYQMGLIYKKMGNTELALVTFIESKYKNPEHLLNRNSLAQTLLEEKLFLEARREFEEINEINPKDEKIRKTLVNLNQLKSEKKEPFNKKSSNKISEKNSEKLVDTRILNEFDSYWESGKKEQCLLFLKREWIQAAKIENIISLETIAGLYVKLENLKFAIDGFQYILEKKPNSYVSHYQLGLLYLPKDRKLALNNFDKAIVLKRDDPSYYIARGITNYKLGKRERARDDFYYALSLQPNLEIASYNLGMILYNDHSYKEAEEVFLDLSIKYPNFVDPYYHLSYIYFEQKKLDLAEKYIKSSLKLERSPTAIFAYIKILEEIQKTNPKSESISLIQSLKKEIVENYPNSSYGSKMTESVLKYSDNRVVIQNYPLSDVLVSSPIYVNGTIVLNYGSSIVRINADNKVLLWRAESDIPYHSIQIGSRIYGISKNNIDQIDLETGKSLWRIKIDSDLIGKIELGEFIFVSGIRSGQEILYSYSIEGELQNKLKLESGDKWTVTKTGKIFLFRDTTDGMTWKILNSELKQETDSFTLIGENKGKIVFLGNTSNCYIQRDDRVYRFEANGKFYRSPKLDLKKSIMYVEKDSLYLKTGNTNYKFNKDLSSFLPLEENDTLKSKDLFFFQEGILTKKDESGKILWSENILDRSGKSKIAVFSVYYRE